ncbi:MAG: amino acid transporter [Blastocatellia bacterium]|nr:amino acid transporter [Blastocatellia bacterium]MBN8722215.1 amino acid transporter [Acidobacteriota bacterium]
MINKALKKRFNLWLLEGLKESTKTPEKQKSHERSTWWKVMCLTGVDYFSTLGYQPSIAILAAGVLSPMATLVLVLVTLFGALPVYNTVAENSPHGQGSISILESMLPRWKGKALVLVLLGFAATGFIITITLSAADATAHIVENPFVPAMFHHPVIVTSLLIMALGLIFLKGFKEAINLAVFLVFAYLLLNLIVIAVGFYYIAKDFSVVTNWKVNIFNTHGSIWGITTFSLLLFPKLALGLSGFETGVSVMPLVKGELTDKIDKPLGRIRNTKYLLTTAAVIMSFFLIGSSLITTILIPVKEFQTGGQANGRALAYLAYFYLGNIFGTIYDLSTISILWFAGASAMVGLLNLVPLYLPKYGMAPDWARASRPLVIFFTIVGIILTVLFEADINAQGGAYATGVLALITSAAIAVSLITWESGWKKRILFFIITSIFSYTLLLNVYQRPEGIKIASFFILTIVGTSLVSRALRSTELRTKKVILDDIAQKFIKEATKQGSIRIVAHRPGGHTYTFKEKEARDTHNIFDDLIVFLEIKAGDASEFTDEVLEVHGVKEGKHYILRCESPAIPNAIAALLLHIRDKTHLQPHVYFGWTEGNPITYVLKYLAFGEGDTAPVTREVLRLAEPNPKRRPYVHVG